MALGRTARVAVMAAGEGGAGGVTIIVDNH